MKFIRILCIAIVITVSMSATFAMAESYPNNRVTMVVPYNPGGGTDILGRIVAQGLSEIWKQPVNVVNRAGASGAVGATYAMQSCKRHGFTSIPKT